MGKMTQFGSMMAAVMFVWAIFRQLFPDELRRDVRKYVNKVVSYVYPYVEITFHEFQGDSWFERSKAYIAIERYLSTNSSNRAKRLKANVLKDSQFVVLSMDDYEEVTDEFKGIKIWWTSSKSIPQQGLESRKTTTRRWENRGREGIFFMVHQGLESRV